MNQTKTHETVLGAGETVEYPAGHKFTLLSTSADVTVKFFKNGSLVKQATDMQDVWKHAPEGGFDRVSVYSATAQTVKIDIDDGGDSEYNNVGGVVTADEKIPTGLDDIADVTFIGTQQKTIIAANASRDTLFLSNDGAAAVRIGTSTAAAARGVTLAAGGSMTLDCTKQIYGYSAGNTSISMMWTEK